MATNPVELSETLGQRLTRQAAWLMSAHTPEFAWLASMQDFLQHLESLPGPSADRFDRIEAGVSPAVFHDRVVASDNTINADAQILAGRELPSDVQAQLRRVIGRDASPVRVHDDAAADTIARGHRADAVTVGRQVFFRQDRFRPREPSGFGLIAHEATHVTELFAPGRAWRRITGAGRRDEERLAEANERRESVDSRSHAAATPAPPQRFTAPRTGLVGLAAVAAQHGHAGPPSPPASPGDAASPAGAAVPPAAQPMAAAEDRDLAAPPSLDMDALRRSLFHDLKQQLQSEFERGA